MPGPELTVIGIRKAHYGVALINNHYMETTSELDGCLSTSITSVM